MAPPPLGDVISGCVKFGFRLEFINDTVRRRRTKVIKKRI